jgi:hypothetical protein
MNVAIFWDIETCSPYVSRYFGRNDHLHLQSRKSAEQETSYIRTVRLNIQKYGNIRFVTRLLYYYCCDYYYCCCCCCCYYYYYYYYYY